LFSEHYVDKTQAKQAEANNLTQSNINYSSLPKFIVIITQTK